MDAQVLARMPPTHLLADECHRIEERKRKATAEVVVTRQEVGARGDTVQMAASMGPHNNLGCVIMDAEDGFKVYESVNVRDTAVFL